MAKSKQRKKVMRRSKGGARSAAKVQGSAPKKAKGGSMMSMRTGFKGIAGSLVGQQSKDKKTSRMVSIFWWVVTIGLGVAAAVIFYRRFA